MRACAATLLVLAAQPVAAWAGTTSPDILINQVDGPRATARGALGFDNLTSSRGAGRVVVSPVSGGAASGPKARLTQPQAVLDRCEAILQNRAAPVPDLDCSAGQLDQLRRQTEAEAASRPLQTLDAGALANDIRSIGRAPDKIDPLTGVPAISVLAPRN